MNVEVRRLVNKAGKAKQIICDKRLDHSGWTPQALACLTDLVARVPLEESAQIAEHFGLRISSSELDRLQRPYSKACRAEVRGQLIRKPETGAVAQSQRLMVLQSDGVYVLGQPEQGECPGLELKTAVLYPQDSPSQRFMLADRCSAEAFLPLLAGLLEAAKLCPKDTLIGLGDGAAWIDKSFEHLQAIRITDVYHACEYLDTVMQALGWDETSRARHRRDWYRGDVNARDWLSKHLPDPELWLAWDESAQTALSYLETRLDSMDYALFKDKGYPIGSGHIEAANKHVIGTRMKRSGMHWSEQGAAAMASLRAQTCARHSLIDFPTLRHEAYPAPA